MNWVLERVDRFWPDWTMVLWAQFAIAIGGMIVIAALAMSVRHYGLGHPMPDSDTRRPSTPARALIWLLFFGGAGAFFLVLGVLTYRWKAG